MPSLDLNARSRPADVDTLAELNAAGDVEGFGESFGTQTIAGETYAGVTMSVYRRSSDDPLTIDTKGKYKWLTGVVGLDGDADCGTPASVSITNVDEGRDLWEPQIVTTNSPKRFKVSIKGVTRVALVGVSRAKSDDDCGGGEANPAWGDVKLTK